jgi:hypothetical protein
VDLGGQVGDGEPVRQRGQRDDRGQDRPDPRGVQADPGHSGGADPSWLRQVVQQPVGDEGGVDAVADDVEPVADLLQPGDDVTEPVQHPPDLQTCTCSLQHTAPPSDKCLSSRKRL